MPGAQKTQQRKVRSTPRWLENSVNRTRFLCLIIGLFVTVVWTFRLPPTAWVLGAADTVWQDTLLRIKIATNTITGASTLTNDVVLVTIDDESVRALGAYPPLPRQLYAHLLKSLEDAGAAVVAFHVVFDGDSPAFKDGRGVSSQLNTYMKQLFGRQIIAEAAADDKALEEALRSRTNVILGSQVGRGVLQFGTRSNLQLLTPSEKFASAVGGGSCLGNIAVEPDGDGIVRRATISGDKFPGHWSVNTSFALRVLEKKFHSAAIENPEGVFVHGKFIPRTFRIDFAGPSGTFEAIPLWKALEWRKYQQQIAKQIQPLMQNPFANKIVLIGYHDLSPSDTGTISSASPGMLFNSQITPIGGILRPMSSAEVQANIVSNLLTGRFLAELPRWEESLLLLVLTCGYAMLAGASRGRTVPLLATLVGSSALWMGLCWWAFSQQSTILPCMVAVIGIFASSTLLVLFDENVIRAERRKRQTRLFRRLASAQVADEIDKKQLAELGLGGKEARITVLVCDIDNLSDLLEGKSAEEAIKIANRCIELISQAVTKYGGVIERYLNHGVVAIWGAPLAQPLDEQAKNAAAAAIEIASQIAAINDLECLPHCAIAVTSGSAVCGMVGGEENGLYTAMGRPVESAFQLLSDNKKFRTRCIFSGSAAKLLADTEYETRMLCSTGDAMYELLGQKGELSGALEEATSLYRRAISALDQHNRAEAEQLLESALRLLPDDGPSLAALASCRTNPESN